jgi:hypothetical protein
MTSASLSRLVVIAPAAFMSLAPSAWADETADMRPADDWSFTIAPYVWAAGMKGTAATLPPLPPVDVDASFQDVLKNLDLAAMVALELRYQKFGGYADIIYTDIHGDGDTPRSILFDEIGVESETFIGTFGLAYRVLEGEHGFLDLLAGARAWSVDTTLTLDGGLLADREIEDNQNWVDPVVGIKGRYFFGHGVFAQWLGHVGGTSANSDSTWDVFGGLGYEFNDTVSAVAGYRHLEVNYEHNGFEFDVELSGPVMGAVIHF